MGPDPVTNLCPQRKRATSRRRQWLSMAAMAPPYAWRAEENSVVVTKVTNVNEAGSGINGYYFVGHNVIDNGDGTYSYHYAVYNLNSEQGCGDFSIPVTANGQLTDIYFNDVEYHSGELQDNTDWTHSIKIANGKVRTGCQHYLLLRNVRLDWIS